MTGAQLKAWRERHGMTQERAAEWVAVSARTWTRYEASGPPMVLALLCTYVDIPKADILGPPTGGSSVH